MGDDDDVHLDVSSSVLGLSGLTSSSPIGELASVLRVQRINLAPGFLKGNAIKMGKLMPLKWERVAH